MYDKSIKELVLVLDHNNIEKDNSVDKRNHETNKCAL